MEITDKEDGFFIRYGISNGVFVELNMLAEFKLLPNILFETKIYNNIGDSWANITIAEKINNLVPKLGELKLLNDPDINFDSITKDYILDFSTNLPEIECFIPILGLTVDTELDIGDIRLVPHSDIEKKLENSEWLTLPSGTHEAITCYATLKLKKSDHKVIEVLKESSEKVLNTIRFFNSLLLWDLPVRHVSVIGRPRNQVSHSFIDDGNMVKQYLDTNFTKAPIRLDNRFIKSSQSHKYDYLLMKYDISNFNEYKRTIFTSIQWFGSATQEIDPMISFVKYYISMEVVTKKHNEFAKDTLPKRISKILYPGDHGKQQYYEDRITEIITERNSVFHSGKTKNLDTGYLSEECYQISRQLLNKLGYLVDRENITSKDDLCNWEQTIP